MGYINSMPTIQKASLNSAGDSPRYMEIARHFEAQRATLSKPLKLPSEQHLASEHQIARDTLRRAMVLLESQGAVTRRRGRGTYLRPLQTRPTSARGKTIGFITPYWATSLDDWILAFAFDGISKWSDAQDCRLSLLNVGRLDNDEHKLLEKISARDLAGLIWVQPVPEQQELLAAVARHIPCVVIGREYDDVNLHTVLPDYRKAAVLLDNYLVERGHKTYSVVSRSAADPYGASWLNGFREAYAQRGAYFDNHDYYIDINPFDRDRLADLLLDFHIARHRPSRALVLTTSSYLIPLLASERFRNAVPDYVSVVTFDYGAQPTPSYWPGRMVPHVTCDWREIGRKSVDILFSLIEGNDAPTVSREPVTMVDGNTVAHRKEI